MLESSFRKIGVEVSYRKDSEFNLLSKVSPNGFSDFDSQV